MSFPNPDNYARDCDCGTAGANTTPPPASLVAEVQVQNLLSSLADPADAGSGSIYAKYGTIYAVSGNTRGVGSVDLQQNRNAATQIALGETSVICGGSANSAAGEGSTVCGGSANSAGSLLSAVLGGIYNTASNDYAIVTGGGQNISSGLYSIVSGGSQNQATGDFSATIGGYGAVANRRGMIANSSGTFGTYGDSQAVSFVLRTLTTTNSPTTMFLDGTGGSSRLTIPPGKILACTVNVSGIRSDSSQGAHYIRKVMIKNVSGTTSLVGTVSTVGTDVEDVAGWDVTITADNTNDALDIKVTGATSSTIRWVAVVQGLEIAYGT
jgi:hypothetical protein